MSEALEELGVGPASPVSSCSRWSEAERLRIVAESYRVGVSVSLVARRNDVHAKLLFTWRRRYGKRVVGAERGGLVRVVVEPAGRAAVPTGSATGSGPSAGRMDIALSDGSRVIVDREMAGRALARVLAVLGGR